jgi:hypothetical protein
MCVSDGYITHRLDDTLPVYTSIEWPKAEILGGPKVFYAVHLHLLTEVT